MKKLLCLLAFLVAVGTTTAMVRIGVDVGPDGYYRYPDGYYYDYWYGPGYYHGVYYSDYPSYYAWRHRHGGGPYYWRYRHHYRYWH